MSLEKPRHPFHVKCFGITHVLLCIALHFISSSDSIIDMDISTTYRLNGNANFGSWEKFHHRGNATNRHICLFRRCWVLSGDARQDGRIVFSSFTFYLLIFDWGSVSGLKCEALRLNENLATQRGLKERGRFVWASMGTWGEPYENLMQWTIHFILTGGQKMHLPFGGCQQGSGQLIEIGCQLKLTPVACGRNTAFKWISPFFSRILALWTPIPPHRFPSFEPQWYKYINWRKHEVHDPFLTTPHFCHRGWSIFQSTWHESLINSNTLWWHITHMHFFCHNSMAPLCNFIPTRKKSAGISNSW